MTATQSNPNPNLEAARPPQPAPEAVGAEALDLKLRRAELRRELQSLGEKSKSYGSELWSDSQHLASSSWGYAKAAATVARAEVTDRVQKVIGKKPREVQA